MNIKNLFIAGLFLSVFLISTYIIACRSDSPTKHSNPERVAAKPITGADQTEKYISYLRGKRVGLVANPTSIIGKQASADSLLALGVKIQKVFGPEHGFRGNASNGAKVQDEVDAKTGLKIISLYGKTAKPTKEHLADIDVMVFDIQDVGCRFYTIINTLEHVMEACAENNKELVILDRPNPNGYFVDGPILEDSLRSGIGRHSIP
ncbi:MAG: DUF1343 domain-containing protein, partial [Bacteroidota bacterium]|nr:DUF1343 domain-containing protein [Bacteroidota bacterium]